MKLSRQFISATKEMCGLYEFVAAPYLRKTFTVDRKLKSAEITITGLGFYDLFINGKKITRGLLSPYISNPDDLVYYDHYDLKPYLKSGENVIGLLLGNGFQNAFGGFVWDFDKASFRSAPKTALWVELNFVDGSTLSFEADESFKCAPSPILYDDLRMGERYDARKEIDGWALPGFDDSGWSNALIAETPKGEASLNEIRPILPHAELKPVNIWQENDSFIYDFGQNLAGVCRLCIDGENGQKVTIVFGEYLKDGKFYTDNISFIRPELEIYPPYIQSDEYTCKGEAEETYTPCFTYHGFRYVKISGITEEQATEKLLTYVVFNTQLNERGSFTCSDETANKLQKMTRCSTISNFHHFPTDCPHREKNGWTADAALSAEHTMLNLDPDINYLQWVKNICKAMNNKGALPGIVPTSGWGFHWGNGPAWDCVLVELPYCLFIYRDDLRAAEFAAPYFVRYINYLKSRTDESGLLEIGLGDWCSPAPVPKSPLVFTDSVTTIDICRKAAVLFDALGRVEDAAMARSAAEGYRKAVRDHLLDKETMTFAGDCQTSQAMALYYGVTNPEEEQKAFDVLMAQIKLFDDHLDTGVLGTRVLFHVLSKFGQSDLAFKMITRPDSPSYGQWVASGDTTLAEDFNGENGSVQSRNHHFFGDISAWFIKVIGGINVNPDAKGSNTVLLSPHFLENLSYAEAYHTTNYGKLSVRWKRNEDNILLTIEIPKKTTGELQLNNGWTTEDNLSTLTLDHGNYKLTICRK